MSKTDLVSRICARFDRQDAWGEVMETDLPGLILYACNAPTEIECLHYQSVICLILQGGKEAQHGGRTIHYGAGQSLIVSHDVHVLARVADASPDNPLVCAVLLVDIDIVRSLSDQIGGAAPALQPADAFAVGPTDAALLDAMDRYFALVEDPADADVMAPLILREIHYRLLTAPHGAMLRNLIPKNSRASRISRALDQLKSDFTRPISVGELAETAGMSVSSFHEHFKMFTETTPLQYQKDLRLMEARRLLFEGGISVSAAAYEVGYESPTQFSREYSRKFGVSPRQDLAPAAVAV